MSNRTLFPVRPFLISARERQALQRYVQEEPLVAGLLPGDTSLTLGVLRRVLYHAYEEKQEEATPVLRPNLPSPLPGQD